MNGSSTKQPNQVASSVSHKEALGRENRCPFFLLTREQLETRCNGKPVIHSFRHTTALSPYFISVCCMHLPSSQHILRSVFSRLLSVVEQPAGWPWLTPCRSSRQLFRLVPRYTPSFVQVCTVCICSLYSSQAVYVGHLDGSTSAVRLPQLSGVYGLTAAWVLLLSR
jgi:hypothetical protein